MGGAAKTKWRWRQVKGSGAGRELTASSAVPVLEEDDVWGALPVGALVDGAPPVDDELGVSAT